MVQLPSDQHITYQLQYRKCGKASCSTCRDGQGHGPYWYAYWREGSRLRSGYIGKVLPAVEDTAQNHSKLNGRGRVVSYANKSIEASPAII